MNIAEGLASFAVFATFWVLVMGAGGSLQICDCSRASLWLTAPTEIFLPGFLAPVAGMERVVGCI
jgi:hypothetical protein